MTGPPVGEYSAVVQKRKEGGQLGGYCNTLEGRERVAQCMSWLIWGVNMAGLGNPESRKLEKYYFECVCEDISRGDEYMSLSGLWGTDLLTLRALSNHPGAWRE